MPLTLKASWRFGTPSHRRNTLFFAIAQRGVFYAPLLLFRQKGKLFDEEKRSDYYNNPFRQRDAAPIVASYLITNSKLVSAFKGCTNI